MNQTMNNIETRILELIESENSEDNELGVIIAARELGKEGCIDLFGKYNGKIRSCTRRSRLAREQEKYYHVKRDSNVTPKYIIFNDFIVYMSSLIAVMNEEVMTDHPPKIDMRI